MSSFQVVPIEAINAGHEKRIDDEVHSHPEDSGRNLASVRESEGAAILRLTASPRPAAIRTCPTLKADLSSRTPAGYLSQDGRQGKGPQGNQRRHEQGEDHKETLVHIEGRGFASPVNHDRPHPAPQGKSAHRGCDDPLAPVDVPRGRLPPSGDEQV